jgi:hypothetical protein
MKMPSSEISGSRGLRGRQRRQLQRGLEVPRQQRFECLDGGRAGQLFVGREGNCRGSGGPFPLDLSATGHEDGL